MGNSYAGQPKTTRFEEVLHNSIEAALRSNTLVPRPVFSQLYLEAEPQLASLEGGSRVDNGEEEEEEEGGLETNGAPNPYPLAPPPEGCCTIDGGSGPRNALLGVGALKPRTRPHSRAAATAHLLGTGYKEHNFS